MTRWLFPPVAPLWLLPADSIDPSMMLYQSEVSNNGELNWHSPKPISSQRENDFQQAVGQTPFYWTKTGDIDDNDPEVIQWIANYERKESIMTAASNFLSPCMQQSELEMQGPRFLPCSRIRFVALAFCRVVRENIID